MRYTSPTNPEIRFPGVSDVAALCRKSCRPLILWAAAETRAGRDVREVAQRAADVGTLTHQAVLAYLRGHEVRWDTDDPDIRKKAEQAFEAFLSWRETSALTVEYAEFTIISETLRVGGRFDALGMLGHRRVLVDWKTGNAIYPEMLVAIAGYGLLWQEKFPELPIDAYALIQFDRVTGDHHEHVYLPPLDEAREAFLTARRMYDLVTTLEKRLR
jgi:hypothetical protein